MTGWPRGRMHSINKYQERSRVTRTRLAHSFRPPAAEGREVMAKLEVTQNTFSNSPRYPRAKVLQSWNTTLARSHMCQTGSTKEGRGEDMISQNGGCGRSTPPRGLRAAECYPDPRPGGEDGRRNGGGLMGIECEDMAPLYTVSGSYVWRPRRSRLTGS